jgi:endonuclease YncB( thermonuclease family)
MRGAFVSALLALAVLAAGGDAVALQTARPAPGPSRHTVAPDAIHVRDGDTFYVGAQAFRLRGIDTPELGEPGADAARARLRALLRAGPVTIVRRAEDVYGRIVVDAYVGGRSVARVLRGEGHAKRRPPARAPRGARRGTLSTRC